MTIKVTLEMTAFGTGKKSFSWSESHLLAGINRTMQTYFPAAIALGNARSGFLAQNCQVTLARISLVGAPRCSDELISVAGGAPGSGLTGLGGMSGLNSDQPNACIQVDLEGADSSQNGRVFCAGVPDDVIRTGTGAAPGAGPGPYLGVPGFNVALQAWQTELRTRPWQFRCRDFSVVPIQILGWNNEPAAPFRLIFSTNLQGGNPVVGETIQIRGVRMSIPREPRPVGQWRVAARVDLGGLTTITLANTAGFSANDIITPGTMERVLYQVVPITASAVTGQTTRRRGVGSVRPRGRSLRRARSLV